MTGSCVEGQSAQNILCTQPTPLSSALGSQEITGDDRFELIKDGTKHSMVIKSVAFEDEAKYMFEAEDKHTSGKLIIEGEYFNQINHL